MRQVAAIKRNCERILATDWSNTNEPCNDILTYLGQVDGNVVNFDATIFNPDMGLITNPFEDYLDAVKNHKSSELYNDLHISQSTKIPIFEKSKTKVFNVLIDEFFIDWTHFYDSMLTLDGGIDVLIFVGTYDQQDGAPTMYKWMPDIQTLQKNNNAFWTQARKVYYIPDGAGNSTVGGLYRKDGRFTFLAMPKAGHYVAMTNMPASRAFLRDYISDKRALGCYNATRQFNNCSTADLMCAHLRDDATGQDCSGHGTCDSMITG